MIEHWSATDPQARVRCQTRSLLGSHCVRYQDHAGQHLYAFRPLSKSWVAPKATDNTTEPSEGAQADE